MSSRPPLSTMMYQGFLIGWAYNHSGSEQDIILPELAVGIERGVEGTTHTLPDLDGEMYLRVKPKNPAGREWGWRGEYSGFDVGGTRVWDG